MLRPCVNDERDHGLREKQSFSEKSGIIVMDWYSRDGLHDVQVIVNVCNTAMLSYYFQKAVGDHCNVSSKQL